MSPTMEPLLSPTGEPTISAAAVMTTQNKESVPKLRVPAGSMTIKDLSDDAGPRMHNQSKSRAKWMPVSDRLMDSPEDELDLNASIASSFYLPAPGEQTDRSIGFSQFQ